MTRRRSALTAPTSIRARLTLTLGVLVALTLLAGGFGWLGLSRTEDRLETTLSATLADVRRVMTLAERAASLAATVPAIARIETAAELEAAEFQIQSRLEELTELAGDLPPLADRFVGPTLVPSIVRLSERLDGIVRQLVAISAEAIGARARLAAAAARVARFEDELAADPETPARGWRALAALSAALAAADVPAVERARAGFPAVAAGAAAPGDLDARIALLADVFDERIRTVSIEHRTRFVLAAIAVSSTEMTGLLKNYAAAVERAGRNRAAETAETLATGKVLVLGVGTAALLAALGFANAFGRDVGEKLQGTIAALRRLAEGDRSADAPGRERRDEIGELARSFAVFKAQAEEREAMERQLRQAQKMEAIGQLTGGIAHDFNNLLAAVGANLQLLHDGAEPGSPARARALRALDAIDHGSATIQGLLAFARRQTLTPEPTDLDALAAAVVDLLSSSVGTVELLHRPADPGRPAVAMVDPAQCETALINLVFNARDAIAARPAGEAARDADGRHLPDRITVATGRTPDGMARLEVADTGSGMAPDVVARIFEPFFTTKPAGAGTGLGLSMVYGFVRQSGGRIDVETALGRGTRMIVDLPASPERAAPAVSPPLPPRPAADGLAVLLVEDEPHVGAGTADVLRTLGHRVDLVTSAEAALVHVAARRPDVVVTDHALGAGLTGTELAARMAEFRPPVPTLVVSADPRAAAGPWPVLAKPYRIEELAAALEAVAAPAARSAAPGPAPAGSEAAPAPA